jgi:hypothetical protein
MNGHLSLRTKTQDEGGAGKQTGWHADEHLSEWGEIRYEDERQSGHKKDNQPNRQVPEKYLPQVRCPDGAAPPNHKIQDRHTNYET